MSKENILMIIPDLGGGGAEHSFSKLSIELSKKFNVIIATFSRKASNYTLNGKIIQLDSKTKWPLALRWFFRIKNLMKIKNKNNVIASISFLEGANYVNILSLSASKTIISLRGSVYYDKEINGIFGWIRKALLIPLLFNRADHIVAVSKGIQKEMIKNFRISSSKIEVIHNFYDINEIIKRSFEPLSKDHESLFSRNTIINVGRLHIQKEHRGLLKVFKEVVQKKDCALLILGDGDERENLLNFCSAQLKLLAQEVHGETIVNPEANVYFLGHVDNPYKYMRKSSLFALSSSWEGFPNALIEAMICQVPTISTDCPTGPREILAPDEKIIEDIICEKFPTKYGSLMPILANCDDQIVETWEAEIFRYLDSDGLREDVSKAASERVMGFSGKKAIEQWLAIVGE